MTIGFKKLRTLAVVVVAGSSVAVVGVATALAHNSGAQRAVLQTSSQNELAASPSPEPSDSPEAQGSPSPEASPSPEPSDTPDPSQTEDADNDNDNEANEANDDEDLGETEAENDASLSPLPPASSSPAEDGGHDGGDGGGSGDSAGGH